jgi:hypothetical protein
VAGTNGGGQLDSGIPVAFPNIKTVHIFGIILLAGATSILDLRLMGLTFRDEPVSKLAERYLHCAWAGFLIQVITGLPLFSYEATKMYGNNGFEIKMLLILVAVINAFVFHSIAYQSVGKWDNDPLAPLGAAIQRAARVGRCNGASFPIPAFTVGPRRTRVAANRLSANRPPPPRSARTEPRTIARALAWPGFRSHE